MALYQYVFFMFLLRMYRAIVTYEDASTLNSSLEDRITSYDSLFTNASLSDQMFMYYRHATSARNSSYPYISGDTFRAFADYIYDETRLDNMTSVHYGAVVFVKTDRLSKFFVNDFNL